MALEEQVVDRLIHLGYTVSFAESCTGGLCCGTLVNVANASKVLNASFVTYANAAKTRFLGVEADTILNYGVVSEQVAAQMARGAARTAESDVVRLAVRFCFCAGVAIFLLIFSARYSIILAVLQRSTLC